MKCRLPRMASGYGDAGPAPLAAVITPVANQITLNPIPLAATVTGGVGSKTYAWSVQGSTTGLSDPTSPTPAYVPYTNGQHVILLVVTDADGNTTTAYFTVTIGDAEGYVYWIADFSDPDLDGLDWRTDGTLTPDGWVLTINGVPLVASGSASATLAVGQLTITGGKLRIDRPDNLDLGVGFTPSSYAALFGTKIPLDYKFGFAVDADITADNDGVFMEVYSPGAVQFCEIRRTAGTQRAVAAEQGRATQTDTIASQGRQVYLRILGRNAFQVPYSLNAWTGIPPLNSAMAVVDPPTSGICGLNVAPGGAEKYTPTTAFHLWITRQNNSRTYFSPALCWGWKPQYV